LVVVTFAVVVVVIFVVKTEETDEVVVEVKVVDTAEVKATGGEVSI
jgi:hypothetical protein